MVVDLTLDPEHLQESIDRLVEAAKKHSKEYLAYVANCKVFKDYDNYIFM